MAIRYVVTADVIETTPPLYRGDSVPDGLLTREQVSALLARGHVAPQSLNCANTSPPEGSVA